MTVYIVLLSLIIICGLALKNDRRKFIVCAFFLMTLFAALRDMSVGKDLAGHYARNFSVIANSDWDSLSSFVTTGGYDIGYVVLCKLIGLISSDPQVFIEITSIIIYGSVARYLYRNATDVFLETYLFMTAFMYFMFMTMIAQALAIAILLFAIEFLNEKKYIRCVILLLLATSLHSSAVICFVFILFSRIQINPKNIFFFSGITGIAMFVISRYAYSITSAILPGYAWYFESARWGEAATISLYNIFWLLFYAACFVMGALSVFSHKDSVNTPVITSKAKLGFSGRSICIFRYQEEYYQLDVSLLVFLSLFSLLCKVLCFTTSMANRLGYYGYLFSITLLDYAVDRIENNENKRIIKLVIYILMGIFFLLQGASAGERSYGVVPYSFFWE